ncbi:hypothetical protein M408DRAFT_23062 [Serendipita vermifera MAFF 305830]|uniref:ATPase inhibitor, mitochondrial n=1 Tax=Serendipita vermifera MAFF 305830 TaxID=933852 RepID=A0A0C2XJQ4_SERVB|nr:hypothetical protein M408DRAFT_23062 [Serendipita vermifera MAFF 305830]
MSAIIKRLVPAASASSSVLRTRTAAVVGARFYSEGATARDPGWSKKEKAVEDQYAHNREVEAIQKMKKQLESKAKELEQREADLNKREKEAGK